VHHLEEMWKLIDVVELALAADEFLLEPLTDASCFMLEKLVKVENVWPILNFTCHIPKIAAVCSKVIYLFLTLNAYLHITSSSPFCSIYSFN